eukprot:TRINITY_DN1794_c0_g1_i1.p1 TRINITY_DN1794_c0_g1~~TRINITY_DN1794_c0_g1_i1.p1  ORF type:complete len:267 (-),score=55.08 TRINITY_DN1794_c0_g1_i1:85-885(-)
MNNLLPSLEPTPLSFSMLSGQDLSSGSEPQTPNTTNDSASSGSDHSPPEVDGELDPKRRKKGTSTDSRRESHKIIEQKRRQKINTKINELRELLQYPEGSQNKAAVLQSAVDNIKHMKLLCSKLLTHHRQLQDDYMSVLSENEKLRKSLLNPGDPGTIKLAAPLLSPEQKSRLAPPVIPPELSVLFPDADQGFPSILPLPTSSPNSLSPSSGTKPINMPAPQPLTFHPLNHGHSIMGSGNLLNVNVPALNNHMPYNPATQQRHQGM